jgi:asparagine synthase (glutamine-hydrolysing)
MFKFHLRSHGLRAPWHAVGNGWEGMGGCISVFRHRALETIALDCGTAAAFIMRERIGGASNESAEVQTVQRSVRPEIYDSLIEEARQWRLHFAIIQIDRRAACVRIEASAWPVAPIYLTDCRGDLVGSWDPLDLYPFVAAAGLDLARAVWFLATLDTSYCHDTLLAGMKCLTAGTSARWQGGKGDLVLSYPDVADAPYPRSLRHDADVLATFRNILDSATRRYFGNHCLSIAAQLSGGLDSAIAAASARRHATSVRTYGISVPGATSSLQTLRRAELVERYQFSDTVIDAVETPVLAKEGVRVREHRIVPWEEIYYEAFDRLNALTARRDDIVLTGFGGNELLPLYWEEHGDAAEERWLAAMDLPDALSGRAKQMVRDMRRSLAVAPRSYLQHSTQDAIAGSSAHFMRHGLWPYHLFATPELVKFCHSLPREWRSSRRLMREMFAADGCSRQITQVGTTEDFTELFSISLRELSRMQFERALRAERLVALKLVDGEALRSSYRAFCEGRLHEDRADHLYAAAILELTLETLEKTSDVSPPTTAQWCGVEGPS